MLRRYVFFCIALVACLSAGMPVFAHNPLPDTLLKVRPAVVAVGTYNPSGRPRQTFRGSGFVVDTGHLVVTNLHVLPKELNEQRKETLAVFSGRGKRVRYHEATTLATDPQHDLALLYISTPLPALELAQNDSIREGGEIAFTGFPLGMLLGLYPVTHRGIVSTIAPLAQPQISAKVITPGMIRAMREASNVLQLDATAYPGNSGSAVYEPATGEVVGVINSVFVKGNKEAAITDPSGISYAIPVRHVRELIKKAPK